MNIYQEKLLRMIKDITSFFQNHNLRYVAAYGTVLGAIRHKGFIPWDDDIDIYMWREDYEKLLLLKEEIKNNGYYICSLNDEGYYLPFVKIFDAKTTLWELKKMPFLIGNFIDVFPLDRFSVDDDVIVDIQKKSRSIFFDYQSTVTEENLLDAIKYLVTGHKTSMIRAYRHAIFGSKPRLEKLRKFKAFEESYTGGTGIKCVCVNMPEGQILKSEWFDDTVAVSFEDTTILVPRKYDEYLTRMYGDWRTPPPIKKQTAKHTNVRYYFNLKERLSLEEVKIRIKQGEYLVI